MNAESRYYIAANVVQALQSCDFSYESELEMLINQISIATEIVDGASRLYFEDGHGVVTEVPDMGTVVAFSYKLGRWYTSQRASMEGVIDDIALIRRSRIHNEASETTYLGFTRRDGRGVGGIFIRELMLSL